MNDHDAPDPLFAVRSYDCDKSRNARDGWLSHRAAAGMPVVQSVGKFDTVPPTFARQFAAMRDRRK